MIGISTPHGEGVAEMTFFGLFALQHRGQEAAGIAVSDGHRARLHKDEGLVACWPCYRNQLKGESNQEAERVIATRERILAGAWWKQ